MQATVDKFGRIVLPKALRDRLGLEAGSVIEIEVIADGAVRLQAKEDRPLLVREEGVLVYAGTVVGGLEEAVARDRDARFAKLGASKARR